MKSEALEEVLKQCKAQGLEPFYLTSTLGTTATCAVDDFASIASVLSKYAPPNVPGEIWVHVDAAYAGAALVCPEYQHLTASFEHFHSFNMNMHKWLLTNFDASCLWIKNRRHLTDALSINPAYLRNEHTDSGLVTDYRDWQIPLGRRFRSLKIWFVLRTYGIHALQAYIRNHIRIGDEFARLIESRQDLFQVFAKPRFALTVFQVRPAGSGDGPFHGEALQKANQLTKRVYEAINAEGQIMITSTLVHEAYVIRVISCSPQTERRHLQRAFEILVRHAEMSQSAEVVQANGS